MAESSNTEKEKEDLSKKSVEPEKEENEWNVVDSVPTVTATEETPKAFLPVLFYDSVNEL